MFLFVCRFEKSGLCLRYDSVFLSLGFCGVAFVCVIVNGWSLQWVQVSGINFSILCSRVSLAWGQVLGRVVIIPSFLLLNFGVCWWKSWILLCGWVLLVVFHVLFHSFFVTLLQWITVTFSQMYKTFKVTCEFFPFKGNTSTCRISRTINTPTCRKEKSREASSRLLVNYRDRERDRERWLLKSTKRLHGWSFTVSLLGRENLLLARRLVWLSDVQTSRESRQTKCNLLRRPDDIQRTVGRDLNSRARQQPPEERYARESSRGSVAPRPLLGCCSRLHTRGPHVRDTYTRVHAYSQWEETGKEQIRREQGSSRAHG